MIPAAFKYASAATDQEAIDLLQQPDAKVLAGGHSWWCQATSAVGGTRIASAGSW